VRYNLTNLVADALSSQLSRGLTSALIMHLGPSVHQDVAAAIKAPLEEMISMHLALAIPEQVESVVPYLVERSLPMVLTRSLTRTLTHALVPSLTHVLTHTKHQDYWCNLCFYNGEHCHYCHSSPESQYYINYYSAYYSDYFAEYYQTYYVKALELVDQGQHVQHPLKEDKQKKQLKHNLGQDDFHEPLEYYRPMTPSGIPADPRHGPLSQNAPNE